tara:strand:- start:1196 stop:1513 length:318 start_codon:yes stop_codon:yes gene_type:complete
MKYWASRKERGRIIGELRPRMYRLKDQAFETYNEAIVVESEVLTLIAQAGEFNSKRHRWASEIPVDSLSKMCAQYAEELEYSVRHGHLKYEEPSSGPETATTQPA